MQKPDFRDIAPGALNLTYFGPETPYEHSEATCEKSILGCASERHAHASISRNLPSSFFFHQYAKYLFNKNVTTCNFRTGWGGGSEHFFLSIMDPKDSFRFFFDHHGAFPWAPEFFSDGWVPENVVNL